MVLPTETKHITGRTCDTEVLRRISSTRKKLITNQKAIHEIWVNIIMRKESLENLNLTEYIESK